MPRRKLTFLVSAYIAGIAAGYFCFERGLKAEAFGFAVSVPIAIVMLSDAYTAGIRTSVAEGEQGSIIRNFRYCMLLIFAAGILMFGIRFQSYETQTLRHLANPDDEIIGRVESVAVKDDLLKLTIRSDIPVIVYISDYAGKNTLMENGFTDGNEYLLTGRNISLNGKYRLPAAADNPGCFDNRLYLRSKGIALSYSADGIEILQNELSSAARFKLQLYKTRENFLSEFDDDTSGFLRGVVFGDKSEINEDLIEEFNANATGHILAVSGLHVGFLYSLLRLLSGRKNTIPISLAVIGVIIIYGEMTLWSAATVRACIVLSVRIMAVHFKRRFDLLSSVSLAAFIILVHQPYQLLNAGFQMTFLALAGIAFAAGPLTNKLGMVLGFMFSVQLGIIPITAYTFYRVNLLSVFINIPIVMLSGFLVPLCIAMLMLMFAFGTVAEAGVRLIDLSADALISINHMLTFDGGFSMMAAGISAAAVTFTYMFVFALCSEWFRVRMIREELKHAISMAAILVLPLFMFGICTYDSFADDEIVFVSVGQGDALHIRYDDNGIIPGGKKDVMIDGGGSEDFNIGERVLKPYLLHSGAGKVELAYATHMHTDHYKGLLELQEEGLTDRAFTEGRSGDVIWIGRHESEKKNPDRDNCIEIIYPDEQDPSTDDENKNSLIFKVHINGVTCLVTGDLGEEGEKALIQKYEGTNVLDCDILKVCHHGSRFSSCREFIEAVSPEIALIGVGKNNTYGHPAEETLERLEAAGARVYRTDIHGAIGIDIKKGAGTKKLKVHVFIE